MNHLPECSVNTEFDNTLVGIEYHHGNLQIHFPIGYRLSPEEDIHGRRKDILLLISTFIRNPVKQDATVAHESKKGDTGFPIQSYLYIIENFIRRGYYRETEAQYRESKTGKINWSRTIKKEKPMIQGNNLLYLNFITRHQQKKMDELITQVHKFCVYKSFFMMGWLFTSFLPPEPEIKENLKLFRSVVMNKITMTFNDEIRQLMKNMLVVLDYEEQHNHETDFEYGTRSFYHVWETMIDRVYGVPESVKEDYCPKTYWRIGGKQFYKSPLEPDSIMPYGKDIYILDAKYYKYGTTKNWFDLPDTSSIHKQITYGEYIDMNKKLHEKYGKPGKIYNAFILPYSSENGNSIAHIGELSLHGVAEARSEWKSNTKSYEFVEAILMDTKKLMELTVSRDASKIMELADCIRSYYESERKLDRNSDG